MQETRFNPWVGKIPGTGNGNLLQYSCLENSMDRGILQASVHGVAKSRTRLNNTLTFQGVSVPSSVGDYCYEAIVMRKISSHFPCWSWFQQKMFIFAYKILNTCLGNILLNSCIKRYLFKFLLSSLYSM